MFPYQPPAVHDNGVRVLKARCAEDQRCSMRGQVCRFRVRAPCHDTTRPRDRNRPVERQLACLNAKLAQALREFPQFRDPDQGLLGYSPIVKSRAAQAVAFDHRYPRAQLQRNLGCGPARGAATQDNEIIRNPHPGCVFRRPSS